MTQYVIDVVLDGTGSVALLGPFRTSARARAQLDRIESVLAANGVKDYHSAISEVYPAAEWFEYVDIKPPVRDGASDV